MHTNLFFDLKEIYRKFGNFNLSFKIAADFEIMLRFLEKQKISAFYLEKYLVKMRLGGESNGSIKNIIKGNKEILKAFKIHNIKYPFYYTSKRWISKLIQYIKN